MGAGLVKKFNDMLHAGAFDGVDDLDTVAGDQQRAKQSVSEFVPSMQDRSDAEEMFALVELDQVKSFFNQMGDTYPSMRIAFTREGFTDESILSMSRSIRARGISHRVLMTFLHDKLPTVIAEEPNFKWVNIIAFIFRDCPASSTWRSAAEPIALAPSQRMLLLHRSTG